LHFWELINARERRSAIIEIEPSTFQFRKRPSERLLTAWLSWGFPQGIEIELGSDLRVADLLFKRLLENVTIRILLADDHKIVRDGLRALLQKQADIVVVGEADNGRTAVELARKLQPNVAILDIGMPELNGIEATRKLVADVPGVKIIALSIHFDRRFVEGMLRAGASGYLLKDCAFEELARAVETVLQQQIYLSPKISGVLVEDYLRKSSVAATASSAILTNREREVLQLLAEGHSTKGIASCLSISVKTVETHRQQIMKKLDRHSIAEITKYAIRKVLLPWTNDWSVNKHDRSWTHARL